MNTHLRNLSGFAALGLLFSLPAVAQQQSSQQSGDAVAEAARKAQEQKKDAPKAKKVYTEDDISTKKSDISVVGQAPVAPTDATKPDASGQPATGTQDGGKKEDPNSEQAWRSRFAKLREKIATAEQELDVLQREESKAGVQYYADPTKAMNEQYSREEINKRASKIDAKKKEVAGLKQQWDDLEDQLRKSGGDPGWARE